MSFEFIFNYVAVILPTITLIGILTGIMFQIRQSRRDNQIKNLEILDQFDGRYHEIMSALRELKAYHKPSILKSLENKNPKEFAKTIAVAQKFFRLKFSEWLISKKFKLVDKWIGDLWHSFTIESFEKQFFQETWKYSNNYMENQTEFKNYINSIIQNNRKIKEIKSKIEASIEFGSSRGEQRNKRCSRFSKVKSQNHFFSKQ